MNFAIILVMIVRTSVYDPSLPLIVNEVRMENQHPGTVASPPTGKDTAVTDFLNIRINSVTTNIQNEEQLVINPIDPNNIVAVWRDFRLGYRRVAYGYTLDGGETWHDTLFVGTPHAWDSDPGITTDANGNFYVVVLSLPSDASMSGIFVFKSQDGGMNWEGPYTVVDSVTTAFEDKELIACDNAPNSPYNGNLYVVWTRFYDYQNGGILISRSTNGGETWSQPQRLSMETYGYQWPVPVVGDSGVLYVAWLDYYYERIRFTRSTDGGNTFSTPATVTSLNGSYYYISPSGNLLVISYPAIATDVNPESPYYGNLYMVYTDSTSDNGMDIFFRKSTDRGETWSEALRLNDDPPGNVIDQFHPWVDVDENGTITVIFYDRRNDPNNILMDLYMTQSFDGGETWTPNVRVTSVSSFPPTKSGLIGEYIGLDTHLGRPFMVWTDAREGSQDVYFGKDTTTHGISEPPQPAPHVMPRIVTNVVTSGIRFDGLEQGTYRYAIFDLSGRTVKRGAIEPQAPIASLEGLKPGIYFVKLAGGDVRLTEKVVKIR